MPHIIYPTDYARMGWSIIPLMRGEKRPALPKWRQYQSTRAEPSKVVEWMKRRVNFGVVTGIISGIVILDLDNEASKRLDMYSPKEPTPIVETPRGFHIYFEHPGTTVSNRAIRSLNVDFRGDGGYAVLPPSINAEGKAWTWVVNPYDAQPQPMPESVRQLLELP